MSPNIKAYGIKSKFDQVGTCDTRFNSQDSVIRFLMTLPLHDLKQRVLNDVFSLGITFVFRNRKLTSSRLKTRHHTEMVAFSSCLAILCRQQETRGCINLYSALVGLDSSRHFPFSFAVVFRSHLFFRRRWSMASYGIAKIHNPPNGLILGGCLHFLL